MKKIDINKNAIILLYHGVTSANYNDIKNYSGKHIHKDVFEEQMNILATKCNPVSLRTLSEILVSRKEVPKRTVAVTFDDCFQNLYHNAFPLLKQYNIPATFFITAGYVETNRIIWADILEMKIAACKKTIMEFDFIDFSKKYPIETNDEKVNALLDIKSYLKNIDDEKKQTIMNSFTEKFQFSEPDSDIDLYKNLKWNQLIEMDCNKLFEIGAHTVNHVILTYVDLKKAQKEIIDSKKVLEKQLKHTIDLFSYPEGQKNHYNDEIIQILKNNGFICSPSAIWGDNLSGDDPFHLKRIMVGFSNIEFPYY